MKPWKEPRRLDKTIRVICVNCEKQAIITLHGFPNEYRGMVAEKKCEHCEVSGKLATNELAKAKVKKDSSRQLKFKWKGQ